MRIDDGFSVCVRNLEIKVGMKCEKCLKVFRVIKQETEAVANHFRLFLESQIHTNYRTRDITERRWDFIVELAENATDNGLTVSLNAPVQNIEMIKNHFSSNKKRFLLLEIRIEHKRGKRLQ